jgi:hypothetical protein
MTGISENSHKNLCEIKYSVWNTINSIDGKIPTLETNWKRVERLSLKYYTN